MKKVLLGLTSLILCLTSLFVSIGSNGVYAMTASEMFSDFSSTSYTLIDKDSGTILYALNANQKMPVASICKLMTTLLTLESVDRGEISLEDMVVASDHACDAEGSQAFLDAGSEYMVGELLKSVIVASANDSAIVLAEALGGTEQNFTKMMNNRANELGMMNTLYANATGLPASGQYSTAFDTAIILKEVGKYDIYNEYCKIWMDTFTHPSGRETELVNTNRLIKYYDYCTSGKTGFTDEAGYCLSSTASKNGMNLVAVVLNCKDSASRFKESMELYNYGFNNFENRKVIDSTQPLGITVEVNKGKEKQIEVIAQNDFSVIDKRGNDATVELKFEISTSVNAPVVQGQVVGKILVVKDGVIVGEVNAVSMNNIDKQNYRDILNKIIDNWAL